LALSERMGQPGLRLQELARGAVSRTIVFLAPPLVFEETVELEYPIVLLEPLAFLLERMLAQVCSRLSERALATQELNLKLELETGIHLEDEQDSVRPAFNLDSLSDEVVPAITSNSIGAMSRDIGASLLADRCFNATSTRQSELPSRRDATFNRTLRLPVPTLDPKIFLKLLQLAIRAHP